MKLERLYVRIFDWVYIIFSIILLLLTICFPHSVVAKEECTITPLNSTNLTSTGGALASGTENVMIQCNCTANSDSVKIRWQNPDGFRILFRKHNNSYVNGTPYVTTNTKSNISVTLVIPTFNNSYDGTYNCGRRVNNSKSAGPSAAVVLYIYGELMIIIIS